MEIDFKTGKVYFSVPETDEEIIKSLEEMKIPTEDSVFSKTIHSGLAYARFKYLFFCFCLILDGLVGIISLGQTQSIIASKFLLSRFVYKEDK